MKSFDVDKGFVSPSVYLCCQLHKAHLQLCSHPPDLSCTLQCLHQSYSQRRHSFTPPSTVKGGSVLPRPLRQSGPLCLHCLLSFDVGMESIDVVTNSAQTTPIHSPLVPVWGEPCICICNEATELKHRFLQLQNLRSYYTWHFLD